VIKQVERLRSLPPKKLGLLQALGVTIYCSLVGILFWKGNEIFGKVNNYIGPVMILVLFIVSAMICSLVVFYQPYKLFFEDKKKAAIDTVLSTTGWLFLFLFVFFLLAALMH
jgi:hypothetical protein